MRASAKSKPSIAMLVKVVCVPMALLGIAAIWAVVAPWLTIARLDRVYGEVQPGMSMEQVDALMSHDYEAQTSGWGSYWEWRPLPASEAARIVSSRVYSVPTIFLGIGYEFTFDAERKIVGKHRLD